MKSLVHHPRVKPKQGGKPTTCAKCGSLGGTLVKDGDQYVHQNKELCRIMKLRRSK